MFFHNENHSVRRAPRGILIDWDLSIETRESFNEKYPVGFL